MLDAESKIYVVVMVLAIIVVGIAGFLFYLEHRLRKSEKRITKIEAEQQE